MKEMYILVIFLVASFFGDIGQNYQNTSKTIIYGKYENVEMCNIDKISVDSFFYDKKNILRNLNVPDFENIEKFENKSIINFFTMCITE